MTKTNKDIDMTKTNKDMDMTKTNKIHNDSVCTWQTRCSVCTWQPAYTHEHVRGGTELLRRGEGYKEEEGETKRETLEAKRTRNRLWPALFPFLPMRFLYAFSR